MKETAPRLLESPQITRLRRDLLRWFARHARDLPWRKTRDLYAIWVSEVMLQQTQVATVIPYFERFLRTLPDVTALARASEEDVLRLWQGLGYYRRARALHQAAQLVVAEHGGRIPEDRETLTTLPGLGRYTVNAILSQALDTRLPILEANSQRVLCRLLGIEDDPKQTNVQKQLWAAAEKLLPKRDVGQFNQAMMELGALVCTPDAPDCGACPLAELCDARQRNLQGAIPRRADPPRIEYVNEVAVVLRADGRVLIARRPEHGRWAGLWEFPHVPLEPRESADEAATRLLATLGMKAALGAELLTIKHAVTRFRITLTCLGATHQGGKFRSDFYRAATWVSPGQLDDYPFSTPQRKLARAVALPRLF